MDNERYALDNKIQKGNGGSPFPSSASACSTTFLDRLTDFLGDTEGETSEEVKEELRQAGIDIDGLTDKVKDMISQLTKTKESYNAKLTDHDRE